ncbi:filaggrin [Drosophila subobscura]|uniref:filaggrin n=1 Tax=Drosophila subobscura TaxID=7241 RepID=UPI00155A2BE4|nr:filaggrin [Drosophila subobscura]XP_034656726.1 filaggrin [Drosophila subobscura]
MAAVVHGCSSPRQRSCNGSSSPGAHHGSTPSSGPAMYTTMPKYSRTASQTLYATSQQIFGSGMGVSMPSDGAYGNGPIYMSSGQRPLSASALPETAAASRSYWGHHAAFYHGGRHYSKRKSAVELLAESKPFYIKSDAVFERLQQSSYRNGGNNAAGSKRGRRPEEAHGHGHGGGHYNSQAYDELEDRRYMSLSRQQQHQQQQLQQAQQYMHNHHPHQQQQHHHNRHGHGHGQAQGRAGGGGGGAAVNNNLLQQKLRMLLGSEAVKERNGGTLRRHELNDGSAELLPTDYGEDEGGAGPGGALRIPPPLYIPSHGYGRDSSAYNSGGEEPLVLTENYRPISPPAEYAAKSGQAHNDRYRYNYQRSYSHSHEVPHAPEERTPYAGGDFNINSHKSLPDLHTQISRHSPHSEILSCCSRGNRSIKSAGESSINRDSGGSSGHYTHRSEPCYKRERQREPNVGTASGTIKNCCTLVAATRRDSGSSTQHSANSYCGYVTPGADYPSLNGRNTECIDCRCKQDTAPLSGYDNAAASDYLLNFTPTPEVPEAFQDDYTPTPPSPRMKTQTPRYSSSSSQQLHTSSQGYTSINHSQSSLVQSPGSAPSVDDISPPPIQFKRQRCIRFKNRNRLPVQPQPRTSPINSSGVEMGGPSVGVLAAYKQHRGSVDHENVFFPKGFSADASYASAHSMEMEREALNASISELEKFFDRLGLNDEAFHEIYSQPRRQHNPETDSDDSSTVFFSDVSTVDSMRLPDSTETQPQTTQTYRPSEPPSIVERNARIIKWLCNCKKVAAHLH